MFTTINVISRNEDTQLYRTILPAELTNEDIRNSESYKEYYAIASGKIPLKTKASKKKADSDATTKQKPPTVHKEKKGKKTLSGSGADEGTGVSPGVPDAPDYDSDDDISWKSSENDQDEDKNEDDENVQDDDDDAKSGDDELKSQDDQDNDDEETNEDDTFDPIVHTPSHVSSSNDEDNDNEVEGVDDEGEKSDEDATYVQVTQEIEDTHVTLTSVNPDGQQQSSSVSSGFVSNMLNPNQDTGVNAIFGHNVEATSLIDIPVTAIAEPYFFAQPTYLANKMKEAVDVAVQLKYDRIREEAQAENQQFLDSIDEGMKKEAKTSHVVDANLSELELKKILIDKMEANKSINRPRDETDDDQEPSAGTDRGSKRRRSSKEPKSTSAPREKTPTTAGKTTTGSMTHKQSTSQSDPVEETMQSTDVFEVPAHQEFQTGVHDEQTEEEVHPLPDWFQQPT
ncbi:hypothetical protein Tco_0972322 [Tanacetum coccineum]